ncbi:MAG: alpha/beta hydrolase [Flavobacteriales bacterium]|nr:alpha/beta hydrolase [Flavobacteriales bacterium]
MKPSILLLHGALGSKKQFKLLKEKLSKQFNFYDFNFEGHGGRESNQAFSIQLFTQNTVEFLEENKLKSIAIFGYSMGAYVALNLAIQHPRLIQKIVTLGIKFDWSKETTAKEISQLNPEKIELKVPAFAQKLKDEHSPNDWKELVLKTA